MGWRAEPLALRGGEIHLLGVDKQKGSVVRVGVKRPGVSVLRLPQTIALNWAFNVMNKS